MPIQDIGGGGGRIPSEPFVVADDEWESWSDHRIQRGMSNVRGEDDILAEVAPSRIADRDFRDWYARAGRLGARPIDGSAYLGIRYAR
jgi:hypothetical protein